MNERKWGQASQVHKIVIKWKENGVRLHKFTK